MTVLEELEAECRQHEATYPGHSITVRPGEAGGYIITVDKNGVGSERAFVAEDDGTGLEPRRHRRLIHAHVVETVKALAPFPFKRVFP